MTDAEHIYEELREACAKAQQHKDKVSELGPKLADAYAKIDRLEHEHVAELENKLREARAAAFEEAAQLAHDQTSDEPHPGDWCAACWHIRDGIRALADAPPQSEAIFHTKTLHWISEARAAAIEEAILFIERGRFLSDDAPTAHFAREVVAGLRRHFALAAAPPHSERGVG